jgi:hypothetical protein
VQEIDGAVIEYEPRDRSREFKDRFVEETEEVKESDEKMEREEEEYQNLCEAAKRLNLTLETFKYYRREMSI